MWLCAALAVLASAPQMASAQQACASWEYSPQFAPLKCVGCCAHKCTSPDGKGQTDCWVGDSEPASCAGGYTAKESGRTFEYMGATFEEYSCCDPAAAGGGSLNASACPRVDCLEHEGLQRCWESVVPSTLTTPVRVVVDMHGYGGDMVNHQSYSGWRDVAAQDGVVVVWPQGATELAGARDKVPSWNAGRCCGAAAFGLPEIDDVGFLRKLAASVAATHGADLASHVYWAGHSNGCAMAQRMAAEAPEIVAAVGCHALYLLLDEFDTPPTPRTLSQSLRLTAQATRRCPTAGSWTAVRRAISRHGPLPTPVLTPRSHPRAQSRTAKKQAPAKRASPGTPAVAAPLRWP